VITGRNLHRPGGIPDGLTYRIYVPAPGVTTTIRPGSAIVGERRDDRIGVDFEGGGRSENVRTFEDFVTHAAGRRSQNYPTIARASYDAGDLVDVGEVRYDGMLREWIISDILDESALDAWAPGPHVVGGSPELMRRATGRMFSRFGSQAHVDLAIARQMGTPIEEAVLAIARRPGRLRD
jgi:hypothetical protein